MMRPGYKPPSRYFLANSLLDKVYEDEIKLAVNELEGEIVCLALDGWENVKPSPIICATVQNRNGSLFLVVTIDTSGIRHTSDNLKRITESIIDKARDKFGCIVRSVVTDNAANMLKMGRQLNSEREDILNYGCGAHKLNLFAHDISGLNDNYNVHKKIMKIVKFFRNHHLPKAWYEKNGGKALIVPLDVRWNTYCDSLESYLKNWSVLASTCEEHHADKAMDAAIGT